MPIVTRGYLERVVVEGCGPGYGTVSEEWRNAVAELSAGQAEIVTIVREWPIAGHAAPPLPITSQSAWDFRFVAPERDEVELLGDALHGLWSVERPRFDAPFTDWISGYLKFCTFAFKLPWPGIERWGCDFHRPRVYIEHRAKLAQMQPVDADAGSQRDLKEAMASLNVPQAAPGLLASLTPATPDEEAIAQERAKGLVK